MDPSKTLVVINPVAHELSAEDLQQMFRSEETGEAPDVMDGADREAKQRFGLFAYIASGLKKAFGHQPHRFTVQIDGTEVIVLNSPSIGHPARDRIIIESEGDVLIQGDGDFIGHTPADVRLIPKAVRVLVPDGHPG